MWRAVCIIFTAKYESQYNIGKLIVSEYSKYLENTYLNVKPKSTGEKFF